MQRRDFLARSTSLIATGYGLMAHTSEICWGQPPNLSEASASSNDELPLLRFGLVTYLWGKDWDLPTLLTNCREANVLGVELRTTHRHGVEPTLTAAERDSVREQFAMSGVTLVGLGSDERFDHPDAAVLKQAIVSTKKFVTLSHDVGGTGVKVKPDRFHDSVPKEKTIEQIARALRELGEYASGFGQQIRLEVHGGCSEPAVIKQILSQSDHPSVVACWNSNLTDLLPPGIDSNFDLLRPHFGDTLHVRQLDDAKYPFRKLIHRLLESEYGGWVLLEASPQVADPLQGLKAQKQLFDQHVASWKPKA